MEKWNELRCDFENKKNRSRYNFQKSIRNKWFCLSDPNNIYEFWNGRCAYMMMAWCGVRSIIGQNRVRTSTLPTAVWSNSRVSCLVRESRCRLDRHYWVATNVAGVFEGRCDLTSCFFAWSMGLLFYVVITRHDASSMGPMISFIHG